MPTYVYGCATCGITVEERRPISQIDDPVPCPLCSEACSREVTTFSIGMGANKAKPGSGSEDGANPGTQPRKHRPGCPCCVPRRSIAAEPRQNQTGES